jgi:Uma2 family endonuclease
VAVAPARHLFTVEEWDRLGRLGFFGEDDRVELIDGEIVDMTPIGDGHAACVARLTRLFSAQVAEDAVVWVQNPIRVSDRSEPQPDLALLRFRTDFYASGKPGPADVQLVVEVAETSLEYDRDRKGRLYSPAGLPEYWLVDLTANEVLVLTDPGSDGYRTSAVSPPGDTLRSRLLEQVEVRVSGMLGPS